MQCICQLTFEPFTSYLDVQKLNCPTSFSCYSLHDLHRVMNHKLKTFVIIKTLFSKQVEQQMAWKSTIKNSGCGETNMTHSVPVNVCVQEGEREQNRKWGECERGHTSAVPHASCSMYSAHSFQSSLLQSQSSVPVCRASQQHGASTWPCQVPGPLARVNKAIKLTWE